MAKSTGRRASVLAPARQAGDPGSAKRRIVSTAASRELGGFSIHFEVQQADRSLVLAVAVLLAELGSVVLDAIVAVSTMVVGGPALTVTVRMNKAGAPTARLALLHVTTPVPPAAGVVQLQPPGDDSDVNMVLAGMASVSVTLAAVLGPLFCTVMV
jgi:hypothetical protein